MSEYFDDKVEMVQISKKDHAELMIMFNGMAEELTNLREENKRLKIPINSVHIQEAVKKYREVMEIDND